jgi:hypothetical protein
MIDVIDSIDDFDKIKNGYTLVSFPKDSEPTVFEIIGTNSDKKIAKVLQSFYFFQEDSKDLEEFLIYDLFVFHGSDDVTDYIFPCSSDKVKLNYPEYFI